MSDDLTLRLVSRLEETPSVRPAFASALRLSLHTELGFAPVVSTWQPAPPQPAWKRLIPSFRPLTLRAVVLAILTMLLVAGAAFAVYLVAHAWLSAGDRGPQYTDDFWLTRVFSQPDALYSDLQLAADGKSAIALRPPFPRPWDSGQLDPLEWAIVRIPLDRNDNAVEVVMPFEQLRHAIDWGAGIDSSVGFVQSSPTSLEVRAMSVGANDDLFVSVSLAPDAYPLPAASTALAVIHADGSAQTILTGAELADAGLLPELAQPNVLSISATQSAPDMLWVRAVAQAANEPTEAGSWLYEMTDPNADGDWSDHVIRPLTLPSTIPAVQYATYQWLYGAMIAEPSTSAHDRSHSVLLPLIGRDKEYQLYRIADLDADGDVTDTGEAALIFSGTTGPDVYIQPPLVTPRVVVEGTQVVIDEHVLGSFSRSTHVSRLTDNGLVDILRALPAQITAVAASADGSIYAASQSPADGDSGWAYDIYRLTPVEVGASPPPGVITSTPIPTEPTTTTAPSPSAASGTASPEIASSKSQLLVQVTDGTRIDNNVVNADASGTETLLSDMNPIDLCLSTDGTRIEFMSDVEVPNEPYVYVADADGTNITKVSETATGIECPFRSDAIVVSEYEERYLRYDLTTGAETEVLKGFGSISPDGTKLLSMGTSTVSTTVGDLTFNSSLRVTDVFSGTTKQIAGPYDTDIGLVVWSTDGTKIAFSVGPSPFEQLPGPDGEMNTDDDVWRDKPVTNEVYVADLSRGDTQLALKFIGLTPEIVWSSDSRTVTVLEPSVGNHSEGQYTIVLVDLATGDATTLAAAGVKWAAWSPTYPDKLAYATKDGLFLIEGGQSRQLVTVDAADAGDNDRVAARFSLGWSPDGRYIARTEPGTISTIDIATGEETAVWADPPGSERFNATWWR